MNTRRDALGRRKRSTWRSALQSLPRWSIAGIGLLFGSAPDDTTPHAGDASARPAHHDSDGFRNLYGSAQQHKGLWPYLKMRFFDERFPAPDAAAAPPAAKVDPAHLRVPLAPLQATWIGHSSVLVQIAGRNVLTDPVFGDYASPIAGFGPKRYAPPGLRPEQLPEIDFVVISHNHYDHLEEATVRRIGDSAHWLVPLGLKRWFEKRGVTRVTELDWWQHARIDGVDFTLLPSQHWSRRGMGDTNKTLWGSWAIKCEGYNVWFGGDTGYAEPLFQEIGRRMGPFDLALIPIGGYGPRWFMREKHADPDDAVRIHRDIRARRSIGIHWGTFVLTSEPLREPAERLAQARAKWGIPDADFVVLARGELDVVAPRVVAPHDAPASGVPLARMSTR